MRRSGAVRPAPATAAASSPKNAAATMAPIRRGPMTLASVYSLAAMTIAPKTASGTTAATINPAVRRARKDKPMPSRWTRAGSRSVIRTGLDESVSHAANGQQVDRPVRVDLYLLAQSGHGDPEA